MVQPSRRPATFEDLLARDDADRLEIIGGEIVEKAVPSAEHSWSEGKLVAVTDPFNRKPGSRGPGGRWILPEIHVVLDEMHEAYEGRCAYLAMYIEKATGNPSVDHVIPRSGNWRQVYAWSNYRLAAALINSKKKRPRARARSGDHRAGMVRSRLPLDGSREGPAVSTSQRTEAVHRPCRRSR